MVHHPLHTGLSGSGIEGYLPGKGQLASRCWKCWPASTSRLFEGEANRLPRILQEVPAMADLSQEQMLGMARIAGLRIPEEDVEHLTIRLNALLEASAVLDEYPLE